MSDLVDGVLAAHGGADRWRSVSAITARGRVDGLLPQRFAGNKLATFTFEVQAAQQHTVLHDFPRPGKRAVFDRGEMRIETRDGEHLDVRTEPRSAFFGLSGIRRNIRWDPLDVAYFAGYASWNYLLSPLLLAWEGVEVREGEPWQKHGETWRRLEVSFPAGFHTHCQHQTFYIDTDGLIRRHDFIAEPVGRWARAALYCDQHEEFDGLVLPRRRRVFPRGPAGRVLSRPTLLALTFTEIEIDRRAR